MPQPLAVFRLLGSVREVRSRVVAAQEAAPAVRDDETGRITREAREARDAYSVCDVTVLSEDGGFCTVIVRSEVFEGREVPARGELVDWPIWVSLEWVGPPTARRTTPRYSVPTDLFMVEQARSKRSTPVAAAS